MAILLCPLHVPKRGTSYVLNRSHAQLLLCKSAIFVDGMNHLRSAFLCRTEYLICRMPNLFGSPSLLVATSSFTGNSDEEAVFEYMPDEPFKTKTKKQFQVFAMCEVQYCKSCNYYMRVHSAISRLTCFICGRSFYLEFSLLL